MVTNVKFTMRLGVVAAAIIGARSFVQVCLRTRSIVKVNICGSHSIVRVHNYVQNINVALDVSM